MIKNDVKAEELLAEVRELSHSGFIIKAEKVKELVANGSLIILKKNNKFSSPEFE